MQARQMYPGITFNFEANRGGLPMSAPVRSPSSTTSRSYFCGRPRPAPSAVQNAKDAFDNFFQRAICVQFMIGAFPQERFDRFDMLQHPGQSSRCPSVRVVCSLLQALNDDAGRRA